MYSNSSLPTFLTSLSLSSPIHSHPHLFHRLCQTSSPSLHLLPHTGSSPFFLASFYHTKSTLPALEVAARALTWARTEPAALGLKDPEAPWWPDASLLSGNYSFSRKSCMKSSVGILGLYCFSFFSFLISPSALLAPKHRELLGIKTDTILHKDNENVAINSFAKGVISPSSFPALTEQRKAIT